jgi:hypothetical protein
MTLLTHENPTEKAAGVVHSPFLAKCNGANLICRNLYAPNHARHAADATLRNIHSVVRQCTLTPCQKSEVEYGIACVK